MSIMLTRQLSVKQTSLPVEVAFTCGHAEGQSLGQHDVTFTLFVNQHEIGVDAASGSLEWEIPKLEMSEAIQLDWGYKVQTDAKAPAVRVITGISVPSLDEELVKFLEENGFEVPEGFRE